MLKEIWSHIVAFDKIIIHRHISPDPDALGSQLGLAALIRHTYKDKMVKTVGFNEPSLSWMGEMDGALDEDYEGALVLIMDTANSARIDDSRYKLAAKSIKIDHHPVVEEYADINYTNTSASSTSEIVVNLYEINKEAYQLQLSEEAATCLYTGIIADSGRFLYDNTTIDTLKATQLLYACEIDRNKIHECLYHRSLNIVQAQGYVLSQFEVSEAGVAYFKMPLDVQKSYQLTTGTRSALVNTLANIEGVLVWVCLFENEDGRIRANIRSNGPAIHEIAAKFDGGGHPKASGAMLSKWEKSQELLDELNEACQMYRRETMNV